MCAVRASQAAGNCTAPIERTRPYVAVSARITDLFRHFVARSNTETGDCRSLLYRGGAVGFAGDVPLDEVVDALFD